MIALGADLEPVSIKKISEYEKYPLNILSSFLLD